jgi:hypothetical protein
MQGFCNGRNFAFEFSLDRGWIRQYSENGYGGSSTGILISDLQIAISPKFLDLALMFISFGDERRECYIAGEWVMVASTQGREWDGEIGDLNLGLYVFKAEDGSQRRLVVQNGGWPSWADSSTVFFHRVAQDGWWSIYKINPFDSSSDQGSGILSHVYAVET